jgi:hypothetical protein
MAVVACPPGRWVEVDAFFRYMQAEDLDPKVARDPWKLYFAEPHYGSLGYDGFHGWSLLQGRYTLCVLAEYAATLGLVDLAHTDPAGARGDTTTTGDAVWTLRRDKYLAAVASGRPHDEILEFLTARAHTDLPQPVRAFFTEAAANARKLRDLGPARVIECDDAALAALIASDRRLRGLCWQSGERHLIVPAAAEARFHTRLHDLGYTIPPVQEPRPG